MEEESDELDYVLAATINGIAAGLRIPVELASTYYDYP